MTASPPAAPERSSTRRTRVFLVGYYGFDNLGDDAIRHAIEAAADRHGVEVARYATRGRPADPRAVPVRGAGTWRYLRAILEADRVVLGGGGILKDEGLWLPVELFLTAVLGRILRRPVALLAVGVGPFYRRTGRAIVRATARLASVRTVRDPASAEALARLGVGRVVIGGDPVFTLGLPAGTLAAAAGRAGRARAVVSVRPWFLGGGPAHEERRAAFRRAIGGALEVLVDAGWQVELVPLYWPRDRDESAALVAASGLAGRVRIGDRIVGWDRLVEEVAAADVVIAMRYHAVAAAAVAGRPAIALAYEPKVASLADELGIPAIDVADPDVGPRLRAAVEATLAGTAGGARPARADRVGAIRDRAEEAIRLALTGRPAAG